MRTKTITRTLYTFDELSNPAKEKAREWMREFVGGNYDWADFIECDAKSVGLEIKGWNLDRGAYCNLSMTERPDRVCELIMDNHGEGCDTRNAAMEYRAQCTSIALDLEAGRIDQYEAEDLEDANKAEFRNNLASCYLDLLRREWEYRMSNEAIDENITANEYEFTEDGKPA
jgi:hypothetical protein